MALNDLRNVETVFRILGKKGASGSPSESPVSTSISSTAQRNYGGVSFAADAEMSSVDAWENLPSDNAKEQQSLLTPPAPTSLDAEAVRLDRSSPKSSLFFFD